MLVDVFVFYVLKSVLKLFFTAKQIESPSSANLRKKDLLVLDSLLKNSSWEASFIVLLVCFCF